MTAIMFDVIAVNELACKYAYDVNDAVVKDKSYRENFKRNWKGFMSEAWKYDHLVFTAYRPWIQQIADMNDYIEEIADPCISVMEDAVEKDLLLNGVSDSLYTKILTLLTLAEYAIVNVSGHIGRYGGANGRFIDDMYRTSLNRFLRELVKPLNEYAHKKGITYIYDPEKSEIVSHSISMLARVMGSNLLEKAMEESGIIKKSVQ